MTDKLREAAQQAERAAFEAWWNDPASADNSKAYEVTPTAEIRRLCQDIATRAWQARAALAQQNAQAVPHEYKLVPVQPTPEMIYAAQVEGNAHTADEIVDDYRAMLNAAPTPPAQQCWKCGDMDPAYQKHCKVPACGMREAE